MHLDDRDDRSRRGRSRSRKSGGFERSCDGDDLAALSRARSHWYDETELEGEQTGYEWLTSGSRANLARRRLERYLDQMKLKDDLEDVLGDDYDDDWTPARRGRKRRRVRRSPVADI